MLDWDSTEKTENLESQEKKTEPQLSETLNNDCLLYTSDAADD